MRYRINLFFCIIFFSFQLNANDFIVDGLFYEINSGGESVSITRGQTEVSVITIPPSVTYSGKSYPVTAIGRAAFSCYHNLTSITIPNSVTKIGERAFDECYSLTSITIPNSVTEIDHAAFAACSGLTSVTIGSSVSFIDLYAFSGCTGLTSVTIPNSVTSIGDGAFSCCTGLTSVNIQNKIIVGSQFAGCTSLSDVTIGTSLIYIDLYAFSGCTGLTSIVVDNGNSKYDSRNNCNAIIERSSNRLITGCKTTIIPNSVTEIGDNAFYGCTGLTSVTIPNSVTAIGERAFKYCSGLASIAIPNSVTSIGDGAFSGCTGLTSVNIQNSVIGGSQFYGCTGLTSVTIPNSVTSIGGGAFYDCSGLRNIYSYITNPPNVDSGVFYGVPKGLCILHVPGGTKWNYKRNGWNFTNIIDDIGVKVTQIQLNKSETSLAVGNTEQLTATIFPDDASYKTLTWSSSNTSVTTVNQNGLVTAKAVGTATITAAAQDGSGVKATCTVNVFKYVSGISLNKSSLKMNFGQSTTLTATITPSDATNKTLLWTSSDESVASVNQNGLVTATGAGTATITATATDGSGKKATCSVTVIHPVTSLTLNKSNLEIYSNKTETLTAIIEPDYATTKTLTWSSSNTSVATVNQNGLVTAKAVGTATITATTTDGTNLSASCEVIVTGITEITLNKISTSICVGDNEQLTATIVPSDVINKTLQWSSSNTSVATVGQNGLVTAVAPGTATITATTTDGTNLSASCKVTVKYDYILSANRIDYIRGSSDTKRELQVAMENRNAITGVQFNITLPQNVTIATASDGQPDVWLNASRKTRSHTVSVEPLENNTYRVLVSSSINRNLNGNDGVLVHMNLDMDRYSSTTGNRIVSFRNVVMSESDETQHNVDNSSSIIHYGYLVGDAIANTKVDVADYVNTANYILNRSTAAHFFTDAANAAYSDNTINVTDLVAITNIILELRDKEYRPSGAPRRDGSDVDEPVQGDNLELQAFVTGKTGNETLLSLMLTNGEPLAGVQFDLSLPQGTSLKSVKSTGRAAAIPVDYGILPDGDVRILMSKLSNDEIETGDGEILTISLAGNGGRGLAHITNGTAAGRDLTAHELTPVMVDLSHTSDIGAVAYDRVRIYAHDGSVIVDSPISGTAQLVWMNGITQPLQVEAGHNVYPMDAVAGDYVVVTFAGTTAKMCIR